MLPIGEEVDYRRRTPFATAGLTLVLLALGLGLGVPGAEPHATVVRTWGLVPTRFWNDPGADWPTLLSATFLHGGPLHLGANLLFLWVFGRSLEHEFRAAFLPFYLTCAVGGSLASAVVRAGSDTPGIGASGAISGVLGAYLVLHPNNSIRAIVLVPWLAIAAILRGDRPVWDAPAWAAILTWFGLQLVSAIAPAQARGSTDYAAHIGGFLVGYLLVRLARALFGLWPDEPQYERVLDRPVARDAPRPTSFVRATRLILAGSSIDPADIEGIERRGYVDPDVVPARDAPRLIGRRVQHQIYRYEPIRWADLVPQEETTRAQS